MKYDERTCKFNMDTGCVELLLRDGRMISIDCTGVEDALDVTMAQRSELDYLVYNDPLGYADLILNRPAFFSVGRFILMESLYFYHFLYGSFIYSMLIFMHTDR